MTSILCGATGVAVAVVLSGSSALAGATENDMYRDAISKPHFYVAKNLSTGRCEVVSVTPQRLDEVTIAGPYIAEPVATDAMQRSERCTQK
jgi:hypothetical protein